VTAALDVWATLAPSFISAARANGKLNQPLGTLELPKCYCAICCLSRVTASKVLQLTASVAQHHSPPHPSKHWRCFLAVYYGRSTCRPGTSTAETTLAPSTTGRYWPVWQVLAGTGWGTALRSYHGFQSVSCSVNGSDPAAA